MTPAAGRKGVAPNRFDGWGIIVGNTGTAEVAGVWKITALKTDVWRVKSLKSGDTAVKE